MSHEKKSPVVSVVIPTYNRANFITKAIKSVLDQTFQDFEVIVVDDGSKDDTEEVVKGFNDGRIRYLKFEANRGALVARNVGIRSAAGKYVTFLDSDDVYLPEKLELQVKIASARKEPCVVHGNHLAYSEEKNITYLCDVPRLEGYVYDELLKWPGPSFPCLFAPKECFEKIGFLDENVPSDEEWDTSIRLSKYYEFVYIDQPLIVYNKHLQDSITKSIAKEGKGWEYIVNKHQSDILQRVGKRYLSKHYSMIGWIYHDAGNLIKAKEYFLKAFSLDKSPQRCVEFLLAISDKGVTNYCAKYYRSIKRNILKRKQYQVKGRQHLPSGGLCTSDGKEV